MRVVVTGASGFVGAHTVQALVAAGHEVVGSARSAERVKRALAPLDCAHVDVVEADISDQRAVAAALRGADAVVHAAAVYSHDVRERRQILATNPLGTQLVLGQAAGMGLDPIVHVSSYVALLPLRGTMVPDSPIGLPRTPYALSKARSEVIARRLQREGAPVAITYPGMVWGPHDPAFGESTRLAQAVLAGEIRVGAPGAVPLVDVRDVAALHAALLCTGRGPRRFLAAAEVVRMKDILSIVATLADRPAPVGTVPGPIMLGLARITDLLQRFVQHRLVPDYQSVWTALNCPSIDTSATVEELGITFTAVDTTIADTIRWMHATD